MSLLGTRPSLGETARLSSSGGVRPRIPSAIPVRGGAARVFRRSARSSSRCCCFLGRSFRGVRLEREGREGCLFFRQRTCCIFLSILATSLKAFSYTSFLYYSNCTVVIFIIVEISARYTDLWQVSGISRIAGSGSRICLKRGKIP